MVYIVDCGQNRPVCLAGGEIAESFEFPFMTIISHKNWICSGSIISNEWVLTAAHCFSFNQLFNLKANDVKLVAGLVNYVQQTYYTQIRRGIEIHLHPNYKVSKVVGRVHTKQLISFHL